MALRLDRVDSRSRLKPRREPYWHRVAEGRHIGFRKMAPGATGTWLARATSGEKYKQRPLCEFIEYEERHRFDEASKVAKEWFDHLDLGGSTERVSVKEICDAYVREIDAGEAPRGSAPDENDKGEYIPRSSAAIDAAGRFRRLVNDKALGRIELSRLTSRDVGKRRPCTVWRKLRDRSIFVRSGHTRYVSMIEGDGHDGTRRY